jgi:hypothetical protein
MSDLTLESAHCFSSAAASTCEVVDAAIRSTYTTVARSHDLCRRGDELGAFVQQML